MSRKVLTGTYASGYTLHPPVTILTVTASGYVGGTGIASSYGAQRAYTIVNLGTIHGSVTGYIPGNGVYLSDGGKVTNGSASNTSAFITADRGVNIQSGLGTVANFGTIAATERSGVLLGAGGSVTNGSLSDRSATISTAYSHSVGIDCGDFDNFTYKYTGVGGTITNFGTVTGGGGVQLTAGGTITNGAATDTTALISGAGAGLNMFALDGGGETGTATNFGTIECVGISGSGDFGAVMDGLGAGSKLTNGSAGDATALITGNIGVYVYGPGATVSNFGTIGGSNGIAVYFTGSGDTLALQAGSTLLGGVDAGDGTIDAIGGMATVKGDLTNVGAVVGAGALTASGAVSLFSQGSKITGAQVTLGGEAYLTGNLNLAAKGALTARSLVAGAGDTITLSGAGSSVSVTNNATVGTGGMIDALSGTVVQLSGAVNNAGVLEVSLGTMRLTGPLANSGSLQIKGGTLQVAATSLGTVDFTGTTGVLELGTSILTAYETVTYTGSVTGLSTSGKSSLDFLEVPDAAPTVTYVDNGHETGGVLTVTGDIAGQGQADVITLVGDYVGGTFLASSDGQGGTQVTYSTANTPTPPHGFIAAMASLGSRAGETVHSSGAFPARETPLISPRVAIA